MPHGTLRVCRVINAMWMGGVQCRLLELLPRLQQMNCETAVVCLRSKGELYPELARRGIMGAHVRIRRRISPPSVWRLARYFRKHRFHVVHTHMYPANITGVLAATIARVPCIVSQVHNIDMYKNERQALTDRFFLGLRDQMICVSDAVRQNTAEHMRISPDHLGVLLNGINTEKQNSRQREDVLRELQIPSNSLVIAHVARLHPQKAHRGYFTHLPRIIAEFPNCHLLLAGEGEEHKALASIAESNGIAGNVHLLRNRNDIPDLLAAADISILPSDKEGFSNVVLESMLYGAAMVVTDVGGAREQIHDGVDGFIIPRGDMNAFCNRVTALLRDEKLRLKLTEAASRKVQRFSLERMAEQTLALYHRSLRSKNAWPISEDPTQYGKAVSGESLDITGANQWRIAPH